MPNAISYTIAEGVAVSGIGRSILYKHIKTGELPIIKLGRRTLIAADDLRALIERHRIVMSDVEPAQSITDDSPARANRDRNDAIAELTISPTESE
jgi:excisionase family DNA binding protein